MKIFCDTNIVMEFLLQRQFADQVSRIISNSLENDDELLISFGSFYTITYLTERYLKNDHSLSKVERIERLRLILNSVLDTFRLADQFSSSLNEGVNDQSFDDLEDSYQAHVAEEAECNILLTINDRHFANYSKMSSVKVKTPVDFIREFL